MNLIVFIVAFVAEIAVLFFYCRQPHDSRLASGLALLMLVLAFIAGTALCGPELTDLSM